MLDNARALLYIGAEAISDTPGSGLIVNRVRIGLAGIGGFGATHVAAASRLADESLVRIIAFADPRTDAPDAARLRQSGARGYSDGMALIAGEPDLQLLCVASPPHTHFAIAEAALSRGIHVLLEKPPCLRIQDLRRLIALEAENDCFCAVGFHDVARPQMITLKRLLCEGALGRIRAVHAHARWVRTDRYYERADWSGSVEVDGALALDGPMNNALAHVLNLAAYLAGDEPHEFALPSRVQGELYRSTPYTCEDTSCLRARMNSEVELCIHLTQAASTQHRRCWRVVGDHGVAEVRDGEPIALPLETIPWVEPENPTLTLLRRLVEVATGSDEPLLMPLAEAEGFLLLSNGAYESAGAIRAIPPEHLDERILPDGRYNHVRHIDTWMRDAAISGRLLSECDIPWATSTPAFDLDGYSAFPMRWAP